MRNNRENYNIILGNRFNAIVEFPAITDLVITNRLSLLSLAFTVKENILAKSKW